MTASALLFVRCLFDVKGTGSLKAFAKVAVVSLLPRLDRSGGGGKGCPVIEACRGCRCVDNEREWSLDIDRLSSVSVEIDECSSGVDDDRLA